MVIKWGDDINEKRKVLTSCLTELTSEDDLGNKRVKFEFLSGATTFVEKTYIEKWELYTFRKGGQKTVESETLFWADLLLSKVLRWEKDTTTRLWSIPFMATNSNTKRGSSKTSTESQRKKIFIVDSSDEESEPKNTSSADVISSTVGESTALSDSLSKSVFTDDPKIASNSKDDSFSSSSQSKPTSNREEGVDDGVVKSSEPSESSLSTLKRKRVVDDDDDDDGEESEKEDEFAEPEEEVIFDDKNAVVQLTNFTYDSVNLNTDDSTTTFLVDEFKQMFIQLVDHRYEMVTDEFTASMELLMKFVQCKQRFSSFFIMCESIPETYAQKKFNIEKRKCESEKELEDLNKWKRYLIVMGEKYLTKFGTLLLRFFKDYRKLKEGEDATSAIDNHLGAVTPLVKQRYVEVLNNHDVRAMIRSVSMADEMFMRFVEMKDFKTCRCYLVDHFVKKFLKYDIEEIRSDETKEYILKIMKNISKYKDSNMNVNDRKVEAIHKVLVQVLDPETHKDFKTDLSDIPLCSRLRSSTTFNETDYSGMVGSTSKVLKARNVSNNATATSSSILSAAKASQLSSKSSGANTSPTSRATRSEERAAALVVHAESQSSSKSSGAITSATSRATRSEERAAALVVHAESQSSSKSSEARTERTAASTVANSSATPLSKCIGARSISSYTNASPLLEEAVAVITVRDSPQSSGVPSVVNAIVSPTASGAGRTEALDLANQSLLRLISLIQEWNINLSELGESALTLDAFFKQKSLQSGVTIDKFMDGDKGKGMEFDEDGSVPINVRSDARGDVVFDEEVVAKGVTVDTVVDGDKGNDIEVGSVPVTVRSDARVGVVDTVVDGDEGKGMEIDEDGSVHSDARGDVVFDEDVVAKGVTVDTIVDGDKGNGIEVGSLPVTVRSDARVGVVDTVVDGDEGKGMEVDEDGSVRSDARGDVVFDKEVVAKGVTVDTVVDVDKGNGIEVGSLLVTVRSDARVGVVDTVVDGDEGKGMEVDEDGSVQVDEDGSVPVDTLVDGDEGKKDMGVNVDVSENQTSVNACTFSSADDIKIYQIGNNIRNRFVITSAAGMRFQASVLSLYVHALRVHFMSRRYFATRKIYLDLAKTETYQKHKDNFFLLDQGNLDIDVFKNKHKFENYIGVETLTKAMASMFPGETGFHPTLIQNFSLPRKNCCTNLISTTFSEFIAEQQQQHPAADLSIIFVDFTTSDKIRGAPTVVDFPNRVLVSTVGVYQTVGALYSVIDADCTSSERYACRILNRGQLDCEYRIH